jgi:rhodanese-related sulfurtransferase
LHSLAAENYSRAAVGGGSAGLEVGVIQWLLAGLGLVVGLAALRWVWMLARQVDQLKRDKYYTDSRLKRVPEEIREAVEPLRHQLARVAAGGTVPRETILEGRLFLEISAADAQAVIAREGMDNEGRVLVLDVRTPKEYAVRRIPGARLVPFEELDHRYREEIPDTTEKIFVYCMGGERSRSACDFLGRRGYTNLYNIREGLRGWHGATEGEGEVQLVQIQSSRR